MSNRREEIDATKVEAICNVLKDALPELVHIALLAGWHEAVLREKR